MEQHIRLACLLEATARKPGNVHPQASFENLCYDDFVNSAHVVAPILSRAKSGQIGQTILEAVQVTTEAVGTNTNLGIVLLLAPLVATAHEIRNLRQSANLLNAVEISSIWKPILGEILSGLTQEDATAVYRAIRAAQPGGMGQVEQGDLEDEPTETLLELMTSAKDRDLIAAEYADRFPVVLLDAVPFLTEFWPVDSSDWESAIIHLQLHLMSKYPDTLIARKCGREVAEQSARHAKEVLLAGGSHSKMGRNKLQEMDNWLREDGHRRNPGTTADIITATLFVAFESGLIEHPPFRVGGDDLPV
jgi:triphosphoribosyl-dephospho-CoA synthase